MDERQTFFEVWNRFWSLQPVIALNPIDKLVMVALINTWNLSQRQISWEQTTEGILTLTGIAKSTFTETRNRLAQKGLIEFEKGSRSTSPVYRFGGMMSSADEPEPERLSGIGSRGELNLEPSGEPNPEPIAEPNPGHYKEKRTRRVEEECVPPQPPPRSKYPAKFLEFWALYPKKVGKDAALRAWKNRKGDLPSPGEMAKILEAQTGSEQWQKEGGRFIPNPSTWLNQGRWDDELEQPKPNGSKNGHHW